MNALNPDFIQDVVEIAVERITSIVLYLMDQMVQNGVVFGDEQFKDDAEFAAWYADMAQRGVLDFLPAINMKLYQQLTDRYQKVSAELMGVA